MSYSYKIVLSRSMSIDSILITCTHVLCVSIAADFSELQSVVVTKLTSADSAVCVTIGGCWHSGRLHGFYCCKHNTTSYARKKFKAMQGAPYETLQRCL